MKRQRDFKWALQAFEENPYRFPPLNDADIRHLRRWSEDSRSEQIWRRLSKPLHLEPNDESWVSVTVGFIHVVLAARNEAEANE